MTGIWIEYETVAVWRSVDVDVVWMNVWMNVWMYVWMNVCGLLATPQKGVLVLESWWSMLTESGAFVQIKCTRPSLNMIPRTHKQWVCTWPTTLLPSRCVLNLHIYCRTILLCIYYKLCLPSILCFMGPDDGQQVVVLKEITASSITETIRRTYYVFLY